MRIKTPMARKAAWGYCRRCLAVMLCCVLAFGLTVRVTPRAQAAVSAVAAVAASGAVPIAELPGAATGLLSLISLGVDINTRAKDNVANRIDIMERMGYKWGWQVDAYLRGEDVDEACKSEWDRLVERFASNDIPAGSSFTLSTELAALIRGWARENMDFADGVLRYDERVLFGTNSSFVLTDVDTSAFDNATSSKQISVSANRVGTLARFPLQDLSSSYELRQYVSDDIYFLYSYVLNEPSSTSSKWTYSVSTSCWFPGASSGISCGFGLSGFSVKGKDSVVESVTEDIATTDESSVLFYSSEKNRLYCGTYASLNNKVSASPTKYYDLAAVPTVVETTFAGTAALEETPTKAITVTIPQDMTFVEMGGASIPDISSLAPSDLVVGGTAAPDVPVEGDLVWDNVKAWLENWAATNVPDLINGVTDEVMVKVVDTIPQAVTDALATTAPDVIGGALTDALPGALAETVPGVVTSAVEGAISNTFADTIERVKVQDSAVEDAMTEPDSLGAVFVSKFPFCIPWDVVQAIKLMAAEPVPPKFEVDMYSAMEGYGGFHSSAPVVIDFEPLEPAAVIVRWASMVGFIYCLAMGTKKLIWTA